MLGTQESLYPYKDYVRKSGFLIFLCIIIIENISAIFIMLCFYSRETEIKEAKMQATIIKNQTVPNTANTIDYLLNKVETAQDNNLKNTIENKIVSIGDKAIPDLIRNLIEAKGTKRGVVAMSLIRNGKKAVEPLREFASENPDASWMADYLINEIKGIA